MMFKLIVSFCVVMSNGQQMCPPTQMVEGIATAETCTNYKVFLRQQIPLEVAMGGAELESLEMQCVPMLPVPD